MTTISEQAARHEEPDEGFTLVETLVVTIVFTLILAIISTGVVTMIRQMDRANGQGNDLAAAQKVMSLLDHQVRYANEINTPGTGADGGYYVEFRTGNSNQQQTCHQWRYTPSTGTVAWRTWKPPFQQAGSATATLTSWTTAATGVALVSATPIWQLNVIPSGTPSPTADPDTSTKETLTVTFAVTSGVPTTQTQQFQTTLTAINSTTTTPPANTCTEIGRPT